MIYNKTKTAAVDITQMPNVYRVIENDIKNIDFNIIETTTAKYGNIYFNETYDVNLFGWSGLDQFYSNLKKIQKLKQHDDIAIINRVVLDSSLCVRLLSLQEAKQFWKKDFTQQKNTGYSFQISVVVCDKVVRNAAGFYGQENQILMIEKSDIQTMLNTLKHEFVHVLDHITAITLQQNCDKLIQGYKFSPGKGNGKDDSHIFKTPNDQNKNIDLHDIYNPSKQEYIASFAEIVDELKNTIISDMMFYHRQFYVQDLSNVMFSYVTNYNVLTKRTIDRNTILNKLKELQEETNMLYYDLFEYVLTHNSSYLINKFNNIGRASKTDYNGIVQDMYNQLKHDRYISTPNEVQKKILSAI